MEIELELHLHGQLIISYAVFLNWFSIFVRPSCDTMFERIGTSYTNNNNINNMRRKKRSN